MQPVTMFRVCVGLGFCALLALALWLAELPAVSPGSASPAQRTALHTCAGVRWESHGSKISKLVALIDLMTVRLCLSRDISCSAAIDICRHRVSLPPYQSGQSARPAMMKDRKASPDVAVPLRTARAAYPWRES
jgi:hypothetical protein